MTKPNTGKNKLNTATMDLSLNTTNPQPLKTEPHTLPLLKTPIEVDPAKVPPTLDTVPLLLLTQDMEHQPILDMVLPQVCHSSKQLNYLSNHCIRTFVHQDISITGVEIY